MKKLALRWASCAFFVFLLGGPSAALSQSKKAKPLAFEFYGDFSNEVVYEAGTDPHVEGYSLLLFRQGNFFFGNFFSSDGMVGDTPNGRLDDVSFNPATKDFSFVAKLSTGMEIDSFDKKSKLPSWDWFELQGRWLLPSRIVGKLTIKDGKDLANLKKWHTQDVVLTRKPGGESYFADVPRSYQDWLKIPVNHGPQW